MDCWVVVRAGVGSVIAGAKNVDQVSDNVAAENLEISAEQLAAIDALTRSF